MALNLKKGEKINLTKDNAGLSRVIVGLGWNPAKPKFGFAAKEIDCDSFIFLLKGDKFKSDDDLIYFGHKQHKSKSVIHKGDNRTGEGDGDDEQIVVDLSSIPAEYNKAIIGVNIYKCKETRQDFGMIKSAYCRLVDCRDSTEMYRYNLTENYKGMTAMIFGELYRDGSEWKFAAVGEGTKDYKISDVVRRYA